MDIIKITPDHEKAQSILRMVDTKSERVNSTDTVKFPSLVLSDYYDIIRELISIILLLDGYKTKGDGAHKTQIEYLKNYPAFIQSELIFMDDLRITRNRIEYDGFFVQADYVKRKTPEILALIKKLKEVIKKIF